ncbi:MAG: DUF6320 domain-containing protein [Butyrivibrio sp.]|nr:DUF6320 domain-containing protein [Muribaculum sp.]MCM1552492.1 DUF6320 domain-containing protein [Butyrivibrio sp.]
MSYCVNCGVELEASAKACPLCSTPVINVNRIKDLEKPSSFPKEKGEVETVNRKDMAILLTVFVLATAVTCGLLNALAFRGSMWSLAVIGACVILWMWLFPLTINHRLSVYFLLLLDGGSVALYLYMLAYMIGSFEWCYELGLPIVALVTVLAELLTLCIRIFPKSALTISLYLVTAVGILCTGLELLIDHYINGELALGWSAVVLTVCAILDITIITMLSRRRLRSEVRRRLHF